MIDLLLGIARHMPKKEIAIFIKQAATAYLDNPTKDNETKLDGWCVLMAAKIPTDGKTDDQIKKMIDDEAEVDRIKERLNNN